MFTHTKPYLVRLAIGGTSALTVLLAGCATGPASEESHAEALAVVGECDSLPIDLGDAEAKADELLGALQRTGSPNAQIHSHEWFVFFVRKLTKDFGLEAPSADQVLTYLESLDARYLPRGELRHVKTEHPTLSTITMTFARVLPFGVSAPLPTAMVVRLGSPSHRWLIEELQLSPATALATTDDVERLARCTPSEPPPAAVTLQQRLRSRKVNRPQCQYVGTHEYTPNELDSVEYVTPNEWGVAKREAADEPNGVRLFWQLERYAHLRIHPSNHWPDIALYDVSCPGGAGTGWSLRVDGRTGKVIGGTSGGGIRCRSC